MSVESIKKLGTRNTVAVANIEIAKKSPPRRVIFWCDIIKPELTGLTASTPGKRKEMLTVSLERKASTQGKRVRVSMEPSTTKKKTTREVAFLVGIYNQLLHQNVMSHNIIF